MKLSFWINAFIPQTVLGYTIAISSGPYAGKTAIPLPGAARLNPFNTFKKANAGFLTDQRSFSDLPTASVRMRSIASFDVIPPNVSLTFARHETSGTTEVDTSAGTLIGAAPADMSRCSWGSIRAAGFTPISIGSVRVPFVGSAPLNVGMRPPAFPSFEIDVEAAAGDPLVSAAADIDYEGTFRVVMGTVGPNSVEVSFEGLLDSFPAFEAYAKLDGTTKTLFTEPPPPGNTVMNLPGRANRPIAGRARFP